MTGERGEKEGMERSREMGRKLRFRLNSEREA